MVHAPHTAPRAIVDQTGPWRSALLGATLAIDGAGHCLALATLCFAGAAAAGLGLGTAIFLLGSALATLALARFGGFRLSLAIAQDTTISILAPAIVLAAAAVPGPDAARVATALAVIGTSAFASGFVFWLVGRLRLGRFVRMFPYPVAAGFLASSGYLLVLAAFSILTEQSGLPGIIAHLTDPAAVLRIVPALSMALCLIISLRYWPGATPVLVVIFVFLGAYYAVTRAMGLSAQEAIDMGLLPSLPPRGALRPSLDMFAQIDWLAVAKTAPVLAAVVLLNLIGVLLNTSGVELATRQDVNENKELRVTGLVNMGIGAFGGLTSFLQGGATILAAKLGVNPRAMVAGHCVTLLILCAAAPVIVGAVPVFIPAALLMFIGASMLEDWLWSTRRRLVRFDWLIVAVIVFLTAVFGILPAIGAGLLLALLGFTYATVRLPVVRHMTNAARRRSIRDRSPLEDAILRRDGHHIRILHLQGALFFGSVDKMTAQLRQIMHEDPGLRAVILDFDEVSSFDSSACAALDKLCNLMHGAGIAAHVTGISPGLLNVFQTWGLPLSTSPAALGQASFQHWPRLDQALEQCEQELLAPHVPPQGSVDVTALLAALGNGHPRLGDLVALMEPVTLAPLTPLITANDGTSDVYILVSGQLGVFLPKSGGRGLRVRSMGPGAIVGEGAYLAHQPRSADVISDTQATLMRLSSATMASIDANDRDLAALLLAILARSVSEKLGQTNALLTYAQRH